MYDYNYMLDLFMVCIDNVYGLYNGNIMEKS